MILLLSFPGAQRRNNLLGEGHKIGIRGLLFFRCHCEERSDEAISWGRATRLLRGSCPRTAQSADPRARNDRIRTGMLAAAEALELGGRPVHRLLDRLA